MSFFTSPCNIIHKDNHLNSQLYRKFILSIIVFELGIIIVSILYSALKNSSYKNDNKQTKLQKQRQTNKPISNQTKAQVIPTTISIYDTFRSRKSLKSKKIMSIGENSFDIDIGESVVLEKNTCRSIKGIEMKRDHAIGNNTVGHENDEQNPASIQAGQSQIIDKHSAIDKSGCQQSFSFINIGCLRLSQDKASMYFNILLGHFFITGGLAMQICPELATSIVSGVHCILFIVLLVVNAFFNEKEGTEVKKEEQKVQFSIKQKTNTIAAALIFMINIYLLALAVIRMKQNYFNTVQTKCP